MQRLLLALCIVFSSMQGYAQTDSVTFYYFDKNLNICEPDSAAITGVGIKQQQKLKFNSYYTKTGIPLFNGWFTDSTLAVKEGYFTYFDNIGNKESEGTFHNNTETGYWLIWVNELLGDSILYLNGEKLEHVSFAYYDSAHLSKRTMDNRVEGFAETTEWDTDGTLRVITKITGNTGTETTYYPSGKLLSVMKLKSGLPQGIKFYNEDGSEMSKEEQKKYTTPPLAKSSLEFPGGPSFPGGRTGFSSFFSRNFRMPDNPAIGQFPETAVVTFFLDKAGFAYDIKVADINNRDLENAIRDVFRRMPAWTMNGYKSFGPVTYTIGL